MQNTVVIDGELSLLLEGTADGSLIIPESGEFGVITAMRDGYPAYEGPMEITPTQETQTLDTAMKSVLGNIVINPIPNNYGLITWNGSTLTVS